MFITCKYSYSFLKVIALVAVVFLGVSCATEAQEEPRYKVVPVTKDQELEVLAYINAHRLDHDLPELLQSSIIKGVAYSHSVYMAEAQAVSHDFFFDRKHYLMRDMAALTVAENVGYGYATVTALCQAWLASSSHRSVIEGDYTHFDISAEQDAMGRWYYTNIFVKK